MKWIVPLLFCVFMGTGCASINSGNITDAQFQLLVSQDAAQAQQVSTIATAVTLDSITDAKTKASVSALAFNVATSLETAASAPTFDFTSIDTLVNGLLANSNISQKQLVSALVNGGLLEAQVLLNNDSSLSADRRVILGKALVVAVSQGIINQTQATPQKANLAQAVKRG